MEYVKPNVTVDCIGDWQTRFQENCKRNYLSEFGPLWRCFLIENVQVEQFDEVNFCSQYGLMWITSSYLRCYGWFGDTKQGPESLKYHIKIWNTWKYGIEDDDPVSAHKLLEVYLQPKPTLLEKIIFLVLLFPFVKGSLQWLFCRQTLRPINDVKANVYKAHICLSTSVENSSTDSNQSSSQ